MSCKISCRCADTFNFPGADKLESNCIINQPTSQVGFSISIQFFLLFNYLSTISYLPEHVARKPFHGEDPLLHARSGTRRGKRSRTQCSNTLHPSQDPRSHIPESHLGSADVHVQRRRRQTDGFPPCAVRPHPLPPSSIICPALTSIPASRLSPTAAPPSPSSKPPPFCPTGASRPKMRGSGTTSRSRRCGAWLTSSTRRTRNWVSSSRTRDGKQACSRHGRLRGVRKPWPARSRTDGQRM